MDSPPSLAVTRSTRDGHCLITTGSRTHLPLKGSNRPFHDLRDTAEIHADHFANLTELETLGACEQALLLERREVADRILERRALAAFDQRFFRRRRGIAHRLGHIRRNRAVPH